MRYRKGKPTPEVSNKVDVLASFLSPTTGQETRFSSAGLSDSIHNRHGTQPSEKDPKYLTRETISKSTYQKDLEQLVTQKTDSGNVFNHKVLEATEGISRLSLD